MGDGETKIITFLNLNDVKKEFQKLRFMNDNNTLVSNSKYIRLRLNDV